MLRVGVTVFSLSQVFSESAGDFIRIARGERAYLRADMLEFQTVRNLTYLEFLGAVARIGNAIGGHRVRTKIFGEICLVQSIEILHLLEECRHGTRGKTRLRQDLHADA